MLINYMCWQRIRVLWSSATLLCRSHQRPFSRFVECPKTATCHVGREWGGAHGEDTRITHFRNGVLVVEVVFELHLRRMLAGDAVGGAHSEGKPILV